MSGDSLANKHRPKKFQDIVGQEDQVKVLRRIVDTDWKPSAIFLTGPFGTGKTTLSRLIALALLCDDLKDGEPCGECRNCLAIERDHHPNYQEIDSASKGLVSDIREMKDEISYSSGLGDKIRIVVYDESHMLSQQAQNALLQTLETGVKGTLFVFATTEAAKMLPTIRSRCIELNLKLLSNVQISKRLQKVCQLENIEIEPKALGVIASYVRGHVRDALILLDQLVKIADGKPITNEEVRIYLRLDRNLEVYQFLLEEDPKTAMERLETLLCNYASSDLTELIGEILVNAQKAKLGIESFTDVDKVWLDKVYERFNTTILHKAEQILLLHTDFTTVNYAIAAIYKIIFDEQAGVKALPKRSLIASTPEQTASTQFKKPGK